MRSPSPSPPTTETTNMDACSETIAKAGGCGRVRQYRLLSRRPRRRTQSQSPLPVPPSRHLSSIARLPPLLFLFLLLLGVGATEHGQVDIDNGEASIADAVAVAVAVANAGAKRDAHDVADAPSHLEAALRLLDETDEGGDSEQCSITLRGLCSPCCNALPPPENYNCSLPGLELMTPGLYANQKVNYLSFATSTSSPNFPIRAKEFEECTGGKIVFAEAENVWEDPVRDLGTKSSKGTELYDGYFMSYSHFPEVSALGLAEHLNDRIRLSNDRLKYEDVLQRVQDMGKYRKDGVTNIDFLMYDGDFFVPIIRLDLLEKFDLPLPNTWEEVVEYAKYFNGTDLNDDGDPNDYGFCHFPRLGAGYWDWWWPEALYSTWGSYSQTLGLNQGFFFDHETFEPRIDNAFKKAAEIWKDLWMHGSDGCITPDFITGRCAIGFSPPGCWKGIFLDPDGVSRKDENGTVIWRPTMKSGEYAEPYRFKPFGTIEVLDRETGKFVDCTKERCPMAERIPPKGHYSDDDRASVLRPSPLAGKLINRAPFYWSGGLGTLIRKSSNPVKKDMMWDFFVYTNSPDTSMHDVANYASWLDSWRYSQLKSKHSFVQAGWSEQAYNEDSNVMLWALSKESNGALNLRIPGLARYTRDVVGDAMTKYIASMVTVDQVADEVTRGWNSVTKEFGLIDQLQVYRAALEMDALSEVQLCRLHRDLMDDRNPSECRAYEVYKSKTGLIAPVTSSVFVFILVVVLVLFFCRERKRRGDIWFIKPNDIYDTGEILGKGSFGTVTKGFLRGTAVALKKPHSQSVFKADKIDATIDATAICDPRMIADMTAKNKRYQFRASKKHPLQKEIMTLVQLRHPNIVETLGATMIGGEMVLVLEYMEHETVRSVLKDPNGLSATPIMSVEIHWALQVARGLGFLHSFPPPVGPLLHNDLKSSNVLVDGSFNAHISDFGLACKTMTGIWSLMNKGKAAGSLLWMAPEVLNGNPPSRASDVYVYSMFLCELMTKERPYNVRAFSSEPGRPQMGAKKLDPVDEKIETEDGGLPGTKDHDASKEVADVDVRERGLLVKDSTAPASGGARTQGLSVPLGEALSATEIDRTKESAFSPSVEGAKKKKTRRRVSWFSLRDEETAECSNEGNRSNERNPFQSKSWFGTSTTGELSTHDGADPLFDTSRISSSWTVDINNASDENANKKAILYGLVGGKWYSRDEIIRNVKNNRIDPPFRPDLPRDAPQILRDICIECWHKNPKRRPTMSEIEERLSAVVSTESVTKQLARRGSMLDTLLPREVQYQLASGEKVKPVPYDMVTVIFSDIVNFTTISSSLSAEEVGDLISCMLHHFDTLCRKHDVKKIDVIGDAFMGVVGVPNEEAEHATKAASFALDAIEATKELRICDKLPSLGCVQVRFGIASGPVVGTVIGGADHPKYTLFGDTVNTASRMESSGRPNCCQCTGVTADLIRKSKTDLLLESRGTVNIKGKGEMTTFWVSKPSGSDEAA